MKRTKIIIAYVLMIMLLLSACGEAYKDSSSAPRGKTEQESSQSSAQPENTPDATQEGGSDAAQQSGAEGSEEQGQAAGDAEAEADDGKKTTGFVEAPDGYFESVLFIGDSRCVGLKKYGGMEGPDWFADVGLSVYNIKDKEIALEDDGEAQSIDQVLEAKRYKAVYIGLGINELGYDMDVTASKFSELIDKVRTAQPDAVILLMANIHVTEARSSSDKIYNNENIEALNTRLSMLADFDMIYYIDANPLFDDGNGALDREKSFDDVHIFAKHYPEWAQFLREHAVLLKEDAI